MIEAQFYVFAYIPFLCVYFPTENGGGCHDCNLSYSAVCRNAWGCQVVNITKGGCDCGHLIFFRAAVWLLSKLCGRLVCHLDFKLLNVTFVTLKLLHVEVTSSSV